MHCLCWITWQKLVHSWSVTLRKRNILCGSQVFVILWNQIILKATFVSDLIHWWVEQNTLEVPVKRKEEVGPKVFFTKCVAVKFKNTKVIKCEALYQADIPLMWLRNKRALICRRKLSCFFNCVDDMCKDTCVHVLCVLRKVCFCGWVERAHLSRRNLRNDQGVPPTSCSYKSSL